MRARFVAAFAGLLLFVTLSLAACGGRPVALPDGDYLYACSDGENGYLFSLQNPGRRLQISDVSSGERWTPWWNPLFNIAAHDPRYLVVGPRAYLDLLTLARFSFAPLQETDRYGRTTVIDAEHLMVITKEDLDGLYWARVVNRMGEVVDDLGSVVGYEASPGFEWVLGEKYSGVPGDPDDGLWVQELRGGAPKRLDQACPAVEYLPSEHKPIWLPDGQSILYVDLNVRHSDHVVFYRCNVENEEEEHLLTVNTDAPVDRYAFSLDLRRMAFVTLPYGELDGLHAVDLGTGEVVKMHEGRSYHGISWTRDGRYLVVEVDDGSPAGEGPRKLISFPEGTSYQLTKRYPCWFIHACPAPYTMDDLGSLAP